uniref:Uncharacterized protein n=1 Tax=Populus trichocarpa TaxID=3694 RepID=A0A2K2BK33_POPTR
MDLKLLKICSTLCQYSFQIWIVHCSCRSSYLAKYLCFSRIVVDESLAAKSLGKGEWSNENISVRWKSSLSWSPIRWQGLGTTLHLRIVH